MDFLSYPNLGLILAEQQKTSVPVEIPLSAVVGNAIYDYLTEERPDTGSMRLFLTETHPFSPLTAGGVASVVAKACRLAGIRQNPGDRKGTQQAGILKDIFKIPG